MRIDQTKQLAPGELRLLGYSSNLYSPEQGPLRPFWIGLEPGLAVIYGRNGSGKTYALRAIAKAASGAKGSLYIKSLPPKDRDTDCSFFWDQANLALQQGFKGFHDNMFHFMDEESRSLFVRLVLLECIGCFLEVFSIDEDEDEDEGVASQQQLIEELIQVQQRLLNDKKGVVGVWDLSGPFRQLANAISLIAYKNEIWLLEEDYQQRFARELLKLMTLGQTFVVENENLYLVEAEPGGFFREFAEIAIREHGGTQVDFIDLLESFGGLADFIDDWNARREEQLGPWDGVRIRTGVKDPQWGEWIVDVDLDIEQYGSTTDGRFLESICQILEEERQSLPEESSRFLRWPESNSSFLIVSEGESVKWDDGAIDLINDCVSRANQFFGLFLESAPTLVCVRTSIGVWSDVSPVMWKVVSKNGDHIPLADLSWAEQRWASMAIRLATPTRHLPVKLVLIDEPERGLHRRAERRMASALQDLADTQAITCVVASHSPAFLSLSSARLHHVRKAEDGYSVLESLPTDIEPWMEELGLDKVDILQTCRLFLVVEGEHDLVILRALFGDDFDRHGVQVLPLRGLRNMINATDASFIFRYTEAKVLYLCDNDNHDRVSDVWARAKQASPNDQLEILGEFTASRQTAEGQFLKEFASLAIRFGSNARIDFAALPAEDILDYLPVQDFVSTASSWKVLREEWGRTRKGSFKNWLSSRYGVVFDNESILKSVEALDSIPEDLAQLLGVVLEAATSATQAFG